MTDDERELIAMLRNDPTARQLGQRLGAYAVAAAVVAAIVLDAAVLLALAGMP